MIFAISLSLDIIFVKICCKKTHLNILIMGYKVIYCDKPPELFDIEKLTNLSLAGRSSLSYSTG
jgi:hypothetical protein